MFFLESSLGCLTSINKKRGTLIDFRIPLCTIVLYDSLLVGRR